MPGDNRPDFSKYLAHFTTVREPVAKDVDNPTVKITQGKTAYQRLISILEEKRIYSSTLPWTGRRAVCLTECPWASLIDHSKVYSPYGIGFNKPHIFSAGGGPAYYVRKYHWDKQEWESDLMTFVTPFWPSYRPQKLKQTIKFPSVDYSHEREWRVPHDLYFDYDDIEFIIVKKYEDMAKFPQELKNAIGRDKFIIMEIYTNIERLWPVHNI
jgi:hypothetical protein